MTDHLIQRRPPERNLLAERAETHPAPKDEYQGEVVRYYTATPTSTPEDALYLALAQVQQGSNLVNGISELQTQLSRQRAPRADFYLALGDAWRRTGNVAKAAGAYETGVKLRPHSASAARSLGTTLKDLGQNARAREMLTTAARLSPNDAATWFDLGLLQSEEGHAKEAVRSLVKASTLNPDLPGLWNNVAVNMAGSGDAQGADEAFQKALQVDPYDETAQSNFGRLLAQQGKREEALYHFGKAAALQPLDAANLYEFALTLAQMERFDDSQKQAEAAIKADARQAEAHELLGGLLSRKSDMDGALHEYQEAVRLKPAFSRAQLDLAAALVATGHTNEALAPLREAAKSADPRIADTATRALRQITSKR
jgi:tetratricopeptide (TPR) repeat protein